MKIEFKKHFPVFCENCEKELRAYLNCDKDAIIVAPCDCQDKNLI